MKIFISSVIGGMEEFRDAVEAAARTLRHEVIRAEDFAASSITPQRACLNGVREADVTVLVLGHRYGEPQDSGLSPTHEEYREARERCPVIALVQEGVDPEMEQRKLIGEVQDWSKGHYTASFRDVESIKEVTTHALYDLALAQATGPVDGEEMLGRARQLIATPGYSHGVRLILSLTSSPVQQVLRPIEIEASDFEEKVHQVATFGPHRVLDRSAATSISVVGNALVLEQQTSSVYLDQQGSIRLVMNPLADGPSDFGLALIEEDICQQIENGLRFSTALLDSIDGSHQLTHVVAMVALPDSDHMGWQTRAEVAASPRSISVPMTGRAGEPVALTPPHHARAALRQDARRIAEDLTALLGRARRR